MYLLSITGETELFKKIIVFSIIRVKKHKRIQFSVVFALFMFKKKLLCSFYNV